VDWTAVSISLSLGIGAVVILVPAGLCLGRYLADHEFRGKLFFAR
jgi:ABC-type molybdate transport system permease subunit